MEMFCDSSSKNDLNLVKCFVLFPWVYYNVLGFVFHTHGIFKGLLKDNFGGVHRLGG